MAGTDVSAAPRADPYDVLGVPHDAAAGAVKKRYWRLSLMIHPDKCRHPRAAEAFQAAAVAAKMLQVRTHAICLGMMLSAAGQGVRRPCQPYSSQSARAILHRLCMRTHQLTVFQPKAYPSAPATPQGIASRAAKYEKHSQSVADPACSLHGDLLVLGLPGPQPVSSRPRRMSSSERRWMRGVRTPHCGGRHRSRRRTTRRTAAVAHRPRDGDGGGPGGSRGGAGAGRPRRLDDGAAAGTPPESRAESGYLQ